MHEENQPHMMTLLLSLAIVALVLHKWQSNAVFKEPEDDKLDLPANPFSRR
jgi:hypothetical protein